MPSREKKVQDFRPAAAKSWQSFSLVFMSWKTKSWKTYVFVILLKVYTAKSFKTWKAKSQIVQSLSRLEDMELQKCSSSKLGIPSLERKRLGFRPVAAKSWQLFSLVFMSWKTKSWKTYSKSYLYWRNSIPSKKIKTWKAKSWIGQSLFKAWGHGVAKKM